MKSRKAGSAFILAITLGVAYYFYNHSISPTQPNNTTETQTGAKLPIQSTNNFRLPESMDPQRQSYLVDQNISEGWRTNRIALDYFSKSQSDPNWDWKQPINFWGVVLDEQDNPIDGALVHLSWNDLSRAGTSSAEVITDQNGYFEVRNKTGKNLGVSVEKDGYRRCRWGSIGFEYANPTDRAFHSPDPDRRVIFRLLKRGPREPIVQRMRMEFRVSQESGDVFIDLLGQRAVAATNGAIDLMIHTDCGPIVLSDGRKQYDWKVRIGVPNGGIQKGSECPTEAPEDGYVPEIELGARADGPRSETGVRQEWYFLRSRGGLHFARVLVSVSPAPHGGGPPIVYLHEYVLNPSGSRNLEFYPEMDVSEKYYVPRDR